ncbi:hypothetical protein [Xylella fastidiosa]
MSASSLVAIGIVRARKLLDGVAHVVIHAGQFAGIVACAIDPFLALQRQA